MTAPVTVPIDFRVLEEKATRLRIDSVRATTEAGSGHPTSCASAAEIMSMLFFSVMRYDPKNPGSAANDIFVLSKGHAAPILYAAWAEAGAFPRGYCQRGTNISISCHSSRSCGLGASVSSEIPSLPKDRYSQMMKRLPIPIPDSPQ